MLISRIVLVFCGVAVVLAAMGDLGILLLISGKGPIGVAFPSPKDFGRITMLVLGVLWGLSMLLGWVIARRLHFVPRI